MISETPSMFTAGGRIGGAWGQWLLCADGGYAQSRLHAPAFNTSTGELLKAAHAMLTFPDPYVNDARTASNRFDMIEFRADFKLWPCVLLRRMRESAEGSGLGQ